jgi:hypothetical protein
MRSQQPLWGWVERLSRYIRQDETGEPFSICANQYKLSHNKLSIQGYPMTKRQGKPLMVYLDEEEQRLLDEKMQQAGIKEKSSFIRFLIRQAEIRVIAEKPEPR